MGISRLYNDPNHLNQKFSFNSKNNPKNLDTSCKTDLDLWVFWKRQPCLIAKEIANNNPLDNTWPAAMSKTNLNFFPVAESVIARTK